MKVIPRQTATNIIMIISEEINQRTKQLKRRTERDLLHDQRLHEQGDGLRGQQLQQVLQRLPLQLPPVQQDQRFSCQTYIDVRNGKFLGSIN